MNGGREIRMRIRDEQERVWGGWGRIKKRDPEEVKRKALKLLEQKSIFKMTEEEWGVIRKALFLGSRKLEKEDRKELANLLRRKRGGAEAFLRSVIAKELDEGEVVKLVKRRIARRLSDIVDEEGKEIVRNFEKATNNLLDFVLLYGIVDKALEGSSYDDSKDTKILLESLNKLFSNEKFPTYVRQLLPILKTVVGTASNVQVMSASVSLLAEFFSRYPEKLSSTIKAIVETTSGYNTVYGLESFYLYTSHKNFRPEWITEQLGNQLSNIIESVINSAKKNLYIEYALKALYRIISTDGFHPQWLQEYLVPISETISNYDEEWTTQYAWQGMYLVTSNEKFPTYAKQLLPVIKEIVERAPEEAVEPALKALNAFLSVEGFRPEWLEEYWKPIFNSVLNHPSGEDAAILFSLISKVFCSKKSLRSPELFSVTRALVKNTTSSKAAEFALERLLKYLHHSDFRPEWLNENFAKDIYSLANRLHGSQQA